MIAETYHLLEKTVHGIDWSPSHYWSIKIINLAQGIGCAPRLFTKAMKVPLSHLRENGINIAAYIDDLIVFADSAEQCLEHCNTAILTLQKLGYVVNFQKAC